MINPQWLELPMTQTIFYGPKDVQAIEVRLYIEKNTSKNCKFSEKKLIFFIIPIKTEIVGAL